MSWDSPSWKAAAAEYHANRPELKVVNKVLNGGDPRADIPPATSPKEFGYNSKLASKPNGDGATFECGRASGFKMTAIEWLWPNRFAIGKLGIIAGLPDEGKGQILCDIAARITSNIDKRWPCDE